MSVAQRSLYLPVRFALNSVAAPGRQGYPLVSPCARMCVCVRMCPYVFVCVPLPMRASASECVLSACVSIYVLPSALGYSGLILSLYIYADILHKYCVIYAKDFSSPGQMFVSVAINI